MADPVARHATVTLACHPTAASVARRFAGPMAPPGTSATVELLVSELVTNAVQHARSEVVLSVSTRDGAIRVEVRDRSLCLPVPHTGDQNGGGVDVHHLVEHGRGLQLVSALATRWGTRRRRGGKSVWFEVEAGDIHSLSCYSAGTSESGDTADVLLSPPGGAVAGGPY